MSEDEELRVGLRVGLQTANNHIDQFFVDALEYFEEKTPEPEKELRPVYPEPHEKQITLIDTVINGKKKRVVMLAGRRSGKTTGFSILASEALKAGLRVLYATPRISQTRAFFLNVLEYLQEDIDDGTLEVNLTRRTISRPNVGATGAQISAKTAFTSASLRGDAADLVILDEYQDMDGNLNRVILPMLADRGGCVIYGGTPMMDKTNQLREKYEIAVNDPDKWLLLHYSSYDNPHLDIDALKDIEAELSVSGVELEVYARFVDQNENALWSEEDIDSTRVYTAPELNRVIVSLDVAVSVTDKGTSGITTAGLDVNDQRHAYILASEESTGGVDDWLKVVFRQYDEFEAEYVLVESNQGGNLLAYAIGAVRPEVMVKFVSAKGSKTLRASPVQILYSENQRRVHHVGRFVTLEHQMTNYVDGSPSPDCLDSAVHCITELLLTGKKRARATGRGIKLW